MFYSIENEYLKAVISDLGATLVKFIEKETNTDLVLGFDSEDDYIKNNGTNIGATIGRNCNRIGNARFCLNGMEYQLSVNDNMNQLHGGGINGFGFKKWQIKQHADNEIVLTYYSKDGEEGFPGNLEVETIYQLKGNSLIQTFKGKCDEDTIFNLTNHSYFNLGEDNILNLQLHILSDKYSPTDDYSLTLDEVQNVKNSPYDFTEFKLIGENLRQIASIDNNYVWENTDDKLMAQLKNSHIQLNVYSDLPDMHVYTGYYLNGEKGKYGKIYQKYAGIALECQYYPNAVNYDNYLKPIIKKNEEISHFIKYEIKKAGGENGI